MENAVISRGRTSVIVQSSLRGYDPSAERIGVVDRTGCSEISSRRGGLGSNTRQSGIDDIGPIDDRISGSASCSQQVWSVNLIDRV